MPWVFPKRQTLAGTFVGVCAARSGLRAAGTCARAGGLGAGRLSAGGLAASGGGGLEGAGADGVELAGQPAPLARGGLAVDRPLGRNLVEPRDDVPQLLLGLGHVAAGEGDVERLHLVLDDFLAGVVAGTALERLADALLGGQRMGHGGESPVRLRVGFLGYFLAAARAGTRGQDHSDSGMKVQCGGKLMTARNSAEPTERLLRRGGARRFGDWDGLLDCRAAQAPWALWRAGM